MADSRVLIGKPKGNSMKKFRTFATRHQMVGNLQESAITLSNDAKISIYKKSQKSGYGVDILEEVYRRGYTIWNESFGQDAEQFAFDRVNSFIAGGFAAQLDDDLIEKKENVNNVSARDLIRKHAEPNGFKLHRQQGGHDIYRHADGRSIAVPRHRGDLAPGTSRQLFKSIYKESVDPESRFVGSDSLVKIYKDDTPGQSMAEVHDGVGNSFKASGRTSIDPARQKELMPRAKQTELMKPMKKAEPAKLIKPKLNIKHNNAAFHDLVNKEEVDHDVDGVSTGTKARRQLALVGRRDSKDKAVLARQASYKVNVVDEARLNTIKNVLLEKDPTKGPKKDETQVSDNDRKTKVVVPAPGATPTVYRPDLRKVKGDTVA